MATIPKNKIRHRKKTRYRLRDHFAPPHLYYAPKLHITVWSGKLEKQKLLLPSFAVATNECFRN